MRASSATERLNDAETLCKQAAARAGFWDDELAKRAGAVPLKIFHVDMLVLEDKEWQVTFNKRYDTGQSCSLNAKNEIP
jgi:hypothetical protein